MIFPIVLSVTALAGITWLYNKLNNPGIAVTPSFDSSTNSIPLTLVGGAQISDNSYMFPGPTDDYTAWPVVTLNGQQWYVAPSYIAPVAIGQAKQIADSRGFQLPSPALVDAIWRAADLKATPIPEASDGTPKTMASLAVYLKHKQKIQSELLGQSYNLLGGTHKDIVLADTDFPGLKNGKIGLYGWHAGKNVVANGKTLVGGAAVHAPTTPGDGQVIQQPFGGHGLDWIDYSQGVRLVKKVQGVA